jgi:glycerol-3-phosphate dehydrogenase (NAD(P)+)
MSKVAVFGAGSFGTSLSTVLAHNGHSVSLYSIIDSQVKSINKTRENKEFLPGIKLDKKIVATGDLVECLKGAELLLLAVPTQVLRGCAEEIRELLVPRVPIVSVAKGLEIGTGLRNSQILKSVFKGRNSIQVLSGPSHAEEVARRFPCTVALASGDAKRAKKISKFFHNEFFRVYHNTDIIGVEIGGAVKNIIAIAAGLCDGLKLGDNSKAALLARGLVEIKRFGVACGARASTFDGVSGLGDLVTTCFSPYGRNRAFGEALGKGKSAAKALKDIGQVVEGVPTTEAVLALAKKLKIDMPICKEVGLILNKGKKPAEAVRSLMQRSAKSEN